MATEPKALQTRHEHVAVMVTMLVSGQQSAADEERGGMKVNRMVGDNDIERERERATESEREREPERERCRERER